MQDTDRILGLVSQLLDKWRYNSEFELETRLRLIPVPVKDRTPDCVIDMLPGVQHSTFEHVLRQVEAHADWTGSQEKVHSTDSFYIQDIRMTTAANQVPKEIWLKKSKTDGRIDAKIMSGPLTVGELRTELAREHRLDQAEIAIFANMMPQLVRIKERCTFVYRDLLKMDLTEVRQGPTLEFAKSAAKVYEVEVELLRPNAPELQQGDEDASSSSQPVGTSKYPNNTLARALIGCILDVMPPPQDIPSTAVLNADLPTSLPPHAHKFYYLQWLPQSFNFKVISPFFEEGKKRDFSYQSDENTKILPLRAQNGVHELVLFNQAVSDLDDRTLRIIKRLIEEKKTEAILQMRYESERSAWSALCVQKAKGEMVRPDTVQSVFLNMENIIAGKGNF